MNFGSLDEVVFTSDVDPQLNNHVPERVVRDLQSLSDIYIHASSCESFGLTVFEAALFRNLCVLSEDIEVFHELFADNVIWIKGGDLLQQILKEFKLDEGLEEAPGYPYYFQYYQSPENYYRECAKKIIEELKSSKTASLFSRLKKDFNNKVIYNRQLALVLEHNK